MELAGVNEIGQKTQIVDANFDNSKMDKEDFLKVLLADIKWQNPMDVNDINEFINNSVKLREIEILNNFDDTIGALKELNNSNSLLMASNLIGKKVLYEGDTTYIEDGKGKVSFSVKEFAEKVKVSITDENGNVVEEKEFQFLNPNENYTFEIDNPSLEDGYYKVYIKAYKDNQPVDTTVISEAFIEGVLRDEDSVKFLFSDKSIEIDKIKQIGG